MHEDDPIPTSNVVLEIDYLRSICAHSGDKPLYISMMEDVDKSCFSDKNNLKIFNEINRRRAKGIRPRWQSVLGKPAFKRDAELLAHLEKYAPSAYAKNLINDKREELIDWAKTRRIGVAASALAKSVASQDRKEINATALELAKASADDEKTKTHITRKNLEAVVSCLHEEEKYVTSGFDDFDSMVGGFARGSLVLIAGKTGVGKSMMGTHLALHHSGKGLNHGYLSFEMPERQFLVRLFAAISDNTNTNDLRDKWAYHEESALLKMKTHLHKKGRITLTTKLSGDMLGCLSGYEGYDCVVVDNFGNVKKPQNNLWEGGYEAARQAKQFAMANDMVIVLLVHLTDKNSIRFYTAIEDHADYIWHMNAEAAEEGEEGSPFIAINQKKSRHDSVFDFLLEVKPEQSKLMEVAANKVKVDAVEKARKIGSFSVEDLVRHYKLCNGSQQLMLHSFEYKNKHDKWLTKQGLSHVLKAKKVAEIANKPPDKANKGDQSNKDKPSQVASQAD